MDRTPDRGKPPKLWRRSPVIIGKLVRGVRTLRRCRNLSQTQFSPDTVPAIAHARDFSHIVITVQKTVPRFTCQNPIRLKIFIEVTRQRVVAALAHERLPLHPLEYRTHTGESLDPQGFQTDS